jgi:hypothetical protein
MPPCPWAWRHAGMHMAGRRLACANADADACMSARYAYAYIRMQACKTGADRDAPINTCTYVDACTIMQMQECSHKHDFTPMLHMHAPMHIYTYGYMYISADISMLSQSCIHAPARRIGSGSGLDQRKARMHGICNWIRYQSRNSRTSGKALAQCHGPITRSRAEWPAF